MPILTTTKTAIITAYREFSSPIFDTIEPSVSFAPSRQTYRKRSSLEAERAVSPRIDVADTFSPRPRWLCGGIKFLLMGGSLAILTLDILRDPSLFWIAYFGNWGWSAVCAYFMCSLGAAVQLARHPGDDISLLGRATWALFAISLPSQILIAIMYWLLEYHGSFNYITLLMNGAGIALLLIDGILINRMPLRMKQFYLFQAFVTLYLVWSVAFAFSGLTNPYIEKNTIYTWLDWKTEPASAIMLALFAIILVNPVVFMFCRSISRLPPRRLKTEATKTLEKQVNKIIIEVGTEDAQEEEADVTYDVQDEVDVSYHVEEHRVNDVNEQVIDNTSVDDERASISYAKATVNTSHDNDIEDLASFHEMVYDAEEVDISLGSYTENEPTVASSRIDAYDTAVTKASHNEDLVSYPGIMYDDDIDYTFDKEGVDISFEREVTKIPCGVDTVSFPDLLRHN